jgi:hypothetical protein
VRIAAGAARACYVEIEAGPPDPQPGAARTLTALCLGGRGDPEGAEHAIARPFELLANRPVRFRLLTSSDRKDEAGAIVTLPEGELPELPPIVTVLRFARSSQELPIEVLLHVRRTELGTLDLQLVSKEGDRWKLAFDLRSAESPAPAPASAPDLDPDALARAVSIVRNTFDKSAEAPVAPTQVMKELAAALGPDKGAWPPLALRRLWEPLKDLRGQRGRSPEHEARWLNLVGYCLRPGYGVALDDWRVKEAWRLFNAGLVHDKDGPCRLEWWILWRRLSGGLTRAMQDELGKRVFPHFLPQKTKSADRKAPSPQEAAEMWRTAASLERVHREEKFRLGEALWPRLEREVQGGGKGTASAWVLGRLGARVPLYGPIENVVVRSKAEKWIERLLALDWSAAPRELAWACAEIARASGDRGRDLEEPLRQRAAARLAALPDGARLAQLVLEPTELEAREERAAFGDALPVGLRLSSVEGRAEEAAP